MVPSPKIPEQHIALFGERGSGKTVLASSFYGFSQEKTFSNDLWNLVADDTGQGTRLLQNYLKMKEDATTPLPTRFEGVTYYFSVKLKSGDTKAKKRPFDSLRLAWHDYPGEWFTDSPSSEEEANRRVDMFRFLLRSDVALLLVDGQKLLDHKDEEERYLISLFTHFSQALLRLKEPLLDGEGKLLEFPRIWIIALSKADLFPPDWDVHSFRNLVIRKAADHVNHLRATLQDFVETPKALSLGEDFMLLSSAKFELSPSSPEPVEIDVSKRVGVDLILPVASLLPLERRVQWEEKMEIPLQVLDTVADNADTLAEALIAASPVVYKLVKKLPRVGRLVRLVYPVLIVAVKKSGPQIREINKLAREKHEYLTATLTQFRLDLDEGVDGGLLIKGK
jgi:hypothetical protein